MGDSSFVFEELNYLKVLIDLLFLFFNTVRSAPQMIPNRKCSRTANDPPKWTAKSAPESENGMDFGFVDFFKTFFLSLYFFIN